ncbi:hypothetical protein [Streptomyces sp. NPDC001108]
MTTKLGRLAALVGALLLAAVLSAPSASATVQAAPVAGPQLAPAADWWGIGKCVGFLLPNTPKNPATGLRCAKKAVKGTVDVHKKVASGAAKAVANSVLGDAAKSMAEFTGDFMRAGFGFWLMTDSVQVKDSGVLGCDPESDKGCTSGDPTKSLSLHALMVGIGAGIATLLVMFQGIRMIIQRKGAPLVQVIQGLMINVVVSAAGVAVVDALLIASDKLTESILYVGFGGDDVPDRMALMLLPAIANPMGLLVIALIVLIVGGIQIVMLFLRQAAIPIQALLLPIAGAGQVGGESSRQWLPRLFTSIMVIITYKPMAALIISVGFTEMGNGKGILDFIRGIVTLALSVIALKSLLALFAPLGMSMGSAVSSGGALGGVLGMVGGAMGSQMASGSNDGGSPAPGGQPSGGGAPSGPPSGPPSSTAASDHAAHMERTGPASTPAADSPGESGSIPQQPTAGPEAAAGAETAAAGAGQTAAATGTSTATASTAATAGGPVTIALVAAEAGKQAVNKAGGAVGGTE